MDEWMCGYGTVKVTNEVIFFSVQSPNKLFKHYIKNFIALLHLFVFVAFVFV